MTLNYITVQLKSVDLGTTISTRLRLTSKFT
jgi:hypothetical protein